MHDDMHSNTDGVTRRTVLTHAGVITAAVAGGYLVPGVATAAPLKTSTTEVTAQDKVPTSANGWPLEKEANHVSTLWTRSVPGTGLSVDVRIGDAEAICCTSSDASTTRSSNSITSTWRAGRRSVV